MSSQANENQLYGFEFRDVDNRRNERESCHDIKQLWQRSHEIIGLALQGMKQTEIADLLSISKATVSNTLNSTLGRKKLSQMREGRDDKYLEINDRVKALTIKALDTYDELLEREFTDYELKKKTADTVTLDIAGMRAPTRVDSRSLHAYATVEELEEFRKRGLKAAREAGMLVDIPGEGEDAE